MLEGLQHDCILGMEFLRAHNPLLDWRECTMSFAFESGTCTVHATRVGKPHIEHCSIQQIRHTLRWDRNATAFLCLLSKSEEGDAPPKAEAARWEAVCNDFPDVFAEYQGAPPPDRIKHAIVL